MGGCQRIHESSEVRLKAKSTKDTERLMGSILGYKKNRGYEKVAGRWGLIKSSSRGETEQKVDVVLTFFVGLM